MNAKITQDNLYMLLPLKIGWLAPWLSEDKGISLTDAINRIYRSKLYKKLSTESTQYWHLGPVDLYNELKKEYSSAIFVTIKVMRKACPATTTRSLDCFALSDML